MASRTPRKRTAIPANQRSAPHRARTAAGVDGAWIVPPDSVHALSDREIDLVRGAYRVMAKVGAQQLSLRQVAKETGVSPALFVYHFGSKDSLLLETMRWALVGTVRRIEERLRATDDPLTALSALMSAVFVDPKANRDWFLVYLDLVQYSLRHPSFSGLTEMLREHINGSYAYVIKQGVDAGVFDVDSVDATASRARAIVEGASIQWLQDADWKRSHASLRDQCHLALLDLLTPATTADR
jgi:AcrR family transcriptional regulator